MAFGHRPRNCFIGLLWIVHIKYAVRQSVPSPHIPSVPDGRGAVVERVAVHRAWVGRFPTLIRDGLAAAMRHRHLAAAPATGLQATTSTAAPHMAVACAEGTLLPPCTAPLHSSSRPAPRSASSMGARWCVRMPKRLHTGLQDVVPPVHRVAGCRAACTQGCSRAIARMHRGAGHDAEAPLDRETVAY